MKKTLITLAALAMASVAQAVSLADADKHYTADQSLTEAYTPADGAFTMTLVLDWEKIEALTAETQVLYTARYDSYWGDVCYTKLIVGQSTTTGEGDEAITTFSPAVISLAEGESNKVSLTLNETNHVANGNVAVTFTFGGGKTKDLTFSVLNNVTGTLESKTITTGWDVSSAFDRLSLLTESGLVEHLFLFDEALSPEDILAISQSAIPEPTTATLSLLALAGFAARRRRK